MTERKVLAIVVRLTFAVCGVALLIGAGKTVHTLIVYGSDLTGITLIVVATVMGVALLTAAVSR